MLYAGMLDVSPLVSVLCSLILLAWFLFKNLFMLVSVVFVHNEIMYFVIGKHTISLCTKTTVGVYILLLPCIHASLIHVYAEL